MTSRTAFIAEVREALRKRNKAIKHRNSKVTVERVIERTDNQELEKLEIECPSYGTTARLSLHVWEDRWIRIRADRIGKAGWVWQFDDEGRLAGSQSARDLVALFEASMSAGYWDDRAPVELASIWAPAIAKGPRLV